MVNLGDEVEWPCQSTHGRHWLWTRSALIERKQCEFDRRQKILGDGGKRCPTYENASVTLEYFAFQLSKYAEACNYDICIQETAIVLFSRFYMGQTILDHDPRIVMFACLTLAIKVEECSRQYTIDDVFRGISSEELDPATVLQKELELLDGVGYEIMILHTIEPLNALFTAANNRIRAVMGEEAVEAGIKAWHAVYDTAKKIIIMMNQTMVIPLTESPSMMALYAFLESSDILMEIFDTKRMIMDTLNISGDKFEELMMSTREIKEYMAEYQRHLRKIESCSDIVTSTLDTVERLWNASTE